VDFQLATVTNASPLRVRVDGAASDSPATVVERADSYAPAANDRVLVGSSAGVVYVFGGGV